MNIGNGYVLPMQRCIAGEEVRDLSDSDLLAIIIGTGTRNRDVIDLSALLLKEFGGLEGLFHSGIRELAEKDGIGLKKAVKIHAAFEIGRRGLSRKSSIKKVDSPGAVWRLLIPEMAGLSKEEFRVLVLNNKNHLLKKSVVSVGTVSEAIVHPREVFRDAIREGGAAIIVSHNHPSGITSPSKEDLATTDRLLEAGKIIGIPLLDHVIITDGEYLSLREEGYF